MRRNPLIVVSTVLAWLFRARSQTSIDPRAIRVIDGDTIEYLGKRHRLDGFDAPEIFHPASRHELQQGIEAKQTLAGYVAAASRAELICYETDRYGRTLASLRLDGHDVAGLMTTTGRK